METKTFANLQGIWALLNQLSVAMFATYDPTFPCPLSFFSVIDSDCRNRIEQWMNQQDYIQLQTLFLGLLQQLIPDANQIQNSIRIIDKRLQKISDYVHRNYSGVIRLHSLASEIGMTKHALSRFFKKATGECFIDYVRKIRIEYATKQLLETDDTVADVGYGCGFNTADYFIRIFKEVKGCTPGEYRRK